MVSTLELYGLMRLTESHALLLKRKPTPPVVAPAPFLQAETVTKVFDGQSDVPGYTTDFHTSFQELSHKFKAPVSFSS